MEIQLIISIVTVIGSGVRVAIAEVRGDIRRLDEARDSAERRLDRLEEAHFRNSER